MILQIPGKVIRDFDDVLLELILVPKLLRSDRKAIVAGIRAWQSASRPDFHRRKRLSLVDRLIQLVIVTHDQLIRRGVSEEACELYGDGVCFISQIIRGVLGVDILTAAEA